MPESKMPKLPEFFKDKRNIVLLVFGLIIIVELIWASGYLSKPLPSIRRIIPKLRPQATLSLFPSSGTFKEGETFSVDVKLELTSDVSTDGVDVILSFDKEKLQVQDADLKEKGIQLERGTLYPQTTINSSDNEEGEIKFSALNPINKREIKGGGTIATITFKVLKEGTVKVSFDFTPNLTTDSNVAQYGTGIDILSKVVDGEYTIGK